MFKYLGVLIILSVSIPVSPLLSQDTLTVSMTDIRNGLLEHNLQIRQLRQQTETAEKELLKTRSMYLPEVTASYTFTNTNNPLMAFGALLSQAKITTMNFDPGKLNHPSGVNNFTTQLEIQQPIINLDALYQKRAAEVKTDILRIQTGRTEEQVQFEFKKAYRMLQLAYEMLETLKSAQETALANKRIIDHYFENGLVQKSDVLYAEVRIKEIASQIRTAGSNIHNASDYIFLLRNEDPAERIIKPADRLKYTAFILPEKPSLNPDRKDLRALTRSLDTYKWMIKSSRAQRMPRLNAFANVQVFDKDFAQFGAGGYFLGLQLSWKLFDGLKSRSDQQIFSAQREETEIAIDQFTQQSQLELRKAYRRIADASAIITFAREALEQSREALRIRENRFKEGLVRTDDLLSAETMVAQKGMEYQQAIFNYETAVDYFEFLEK